MPAKCQTIPPLTAAGLLLSVQVAVSQPDFTKVEMKVTRVAGAVYMLEGAGGNIGISVGEDGVVLVDDQFAPLVPKIRQAIRGITDKPIRFVLNTHFHGDHTGGNSQLSAEAPIIAHENVRERLAKGGTADGGEAKPAAKESLPVITFSERATIHLNGEDIRAIHFPHGHTDGDSVIIFPESKVVHMGDDFVTYGFPFVDARSGGSVAGMIAGVEHVLGLIGEDVKIIPGHGPVSTPEDLRKFLKMLKDTRALVTQAVSQGKTAEQMKQERVLKDFEHLGKGFIKTDAWIELLYAEVTKKAGTAANYHNHGHADERNSR